eukprot:1362684-Prymnesium_polylepis.1
MNVTLAAASTGPRACRALEERGRVRPRRTALRLLEARRARAQRALQVVAAGRARVEQHARRRVGLKHRPQEGERRERVEENVVVARAVLVAREHRVRHRRLHAPPPAVGRPRAVRRAVRAERGRGAVRRPDVSALVEDDLRRASDVDVV